MGQTGGSIKGWVKPPEGWYKINVDAAVFSDGCVGLGGVIRDSSGCFLRAKCGRVAGERQPREAETLSLKVALLWAKSLNLDHCLFESDSKVLVEACKGDK